tara:strand:+ start:279 stop:506 length:228 start_codon:yes stop_codon:yes gene_type:complete
MPNVIDKNTGKLKAKMAYDNRGVAEAEQLASSDPNLEVVHQSYAVGGPVRVKARGTGAATRGLDFWEGCSSRGKG